MGTLWPKKWKKLSFLLVTAFSSHRIKCNTATESFFMKGFISSSYTDELWTIYEDIMTYKHENLMI